MNGLIENNSPALTKLGNIGLEAFYRSGRFFSPTNDGLTGHLVRLMTWHKIENIQTCMHRITLKVQGIGQPFYEDMAIGYRVALPFFQKWVNIPRNYQDIYQQALKEMQQPDFVATWTLLTAWGTTSMDGQRIFMRGLR